MATENSVNTTSCTVHSIIPNNLQGTSKLLTFHPALYSLTQKAVTINTCCMVRKFLTEQ